MRAWFVLSRWARAKRSPASAEEPDVELGEERLDAPEMLIGGPERGAAGVGGDGDLEVRERKHLAAVSQLGGKQSNALPGLAIELDPREAREGGHQAGAVVRARPGYKLREDRTAGENLALIERGGELVGDFLCACAQVGDPHRGVGQEHRLGSAVQRS